MNAIPDASSFTARRPNASALPAFELPSAPSILTNFKLPSYPQYSNIHSSQPTSSTLTSVGNLLTPPSNGSADGLSPASGVTGVSSMSAQPYASSNSAWPPPPQSSGTPYGFPSSAPHFGRGHIFSPSLNSVVRGTSSPTATESLPPPPYELPQYSTSMPMSAPSLPAMPLPQQQMVGSSMMGGSAPPSAVGQPSPAHSQDAFARPPPTPTYYTSSQPSSTPQQSTFPYSTGPSPIQQSPISAGGQMTRASPINGHGPIPSLQSQSSYMQQPRTYSYPSLGHVGPGGPVLSNVNNPGGQLALVNGMSHGMPMPYNSGHAAMHHQMYGHHQPQSNAQNDRPFRCDQCPQSFNRNHDLKRHKRIHLAVKPFPCGHCDKSFSRKDALKRHVLVKGCGKANHTSDVKEIETESPEPKSEQSSISPVVNGAA